MIQPIAAYPLSEALFPMLPILEMHTGNAEMVGIKMHGTKLSSMLLSDRNTKRTLVA